MAKRHKPLNGTHIGEKETLADVDGDNEDRISNLPDSILCHILSKLPTKFAVGTAILSSKWKHLFSQIPNLSLDIDDTLLLHPNPNHNHQGNSDTVSHSNANFINFMYHLLTVTLRDVPCICDFSLHCHQHYGNPLIDAWVSSALRRKVQDLTLIFEPKNSGVSIRSLFRCNTLVNFELHQHCVLPVPSLICLPNLKTLFLKFVRFTDSDSLEKILAGCPVVEQLRIEDCEFQSVEAIRISSRTLELVQMRDCRFLPSKYELVLDTPNLERLSYCGSVARRYTVNNANSVVSAAIEIEFTEEYPLQLIGDLAEFVAAFSKLETLRLTQASILLMGSRDAVLRRTTYHNLTQLELGTISNPSGWYLLPVLLQMCPNLQVLRFTQGFPDPRCIIFEIQMAKSVPICLSLRLQTIIIEVFNGKKDELKVLECFLKTASVLEKVEIIWARSSSSSSSNSNSEKHESIRKKVLMLPRCSEICQIDIKNY